MSIFTWHTCKKQKIFYPMVEIMNFLLICSKFHKLGQNLKLFPVQANIKFIKLLTLNQLKSYAMSVLASKNYFSSMKNPYPLKQICCIVHWFWAKNRSKFPHGMLISWSHSTKTGMSWTSKFRSVATTETF